MRMPHMTDCRDIGTKKESTTVPLLKLDRFRAFLPQRFTAQATYAASLAVMALILIPNPAQASYWKVTAADAGGSQTVSKGDDPFP